MHDLEIPLPSFAFLDWIGILVPHSKDDTSVDRAHKVLTETHQHHDRNI